jgi:hypothetical protein
MDMIDLKATYINALTSRVLRAARLPIPLENDRVAIETALDQVPDVRKVRMARIKNTLELGTFWATDAVLPELWHEKHITVDERPVRLEFSDEGRLLPMEN